MLKLECSVSRHQEDDQVIVCADRATNHRDHLYEGELTSKVLYCDFGILREVHLEDSFFLRVSTFKVALLMIIRLVR